MVKVQQELARLNAEMARVQAQFREVNSPRAAEAQELAEQTREAARRFEEIRAQQTADDQARTEEGRRQLTEWLRDTERRVAEARARLETALDGSRQLVSPSGRSPLRVVPPVTAPVPTRTVKAQHSPEAMRARAEGTVTVEALVDERGRVADARVVKSIPLLDRSALEAAVQWEFKPATLNGEPVPVIIQMELNFSLK
jgi:protein TonB